MTQFTPIGYRELMPEETSAFQAQVAALKTVFESHDYSQIVPPTIDYYDRLSPAMGESLKQQTVRFIDGDGHVMCLRPDNTLAVARTVATRLNKTSLPINLFYLESVFRNKIGKSNQSIETFQAGVERIGDAKIEADAAVILLCIRALKAMGETDFGIDIGHVDFVANLSETQKEALLKRDYIAFGSIPKRGKLDVVQDFPDLVKLYRIIEEAGEADHIFFNRGLVKNIQYYTGVIFECYSLSRRGHIGSGGRYDKVLAQFGYDVPAVGFALNLD